MPEGGKLLDWLAPTGRLVFVLGVALSLFQLWRPVVGFVPPGVVAV